MDYEQIEHLRERHAAWSLLSSDNVALVLSFLGRMFVDANANNIPAAQLESALDDELFALNQRLGEGRWSRSTPSQHRAEYLMWDVGTSSVVKSKVIPGAGRSVTYTTPAPGAPRRAPSARPASPEGKQAENLRRQARRQRSALVDYCRSNCLVTSCGISQRSPEAASPTGRP